MKKTAWIRLFKGALLVLPIVCVILFAQSYLMFFDDHNTYRISDFYKEPPNSLDVVMIGASDVFTGFSPVHAYAQTGLTSYPFCFDGASACLHLPALKEVLKRQNPQMIMVEIQCFLGYNQFTEAQLRYLTENIPMSWNKLKTVMEHPYEDKLSCLFPFFKYHGEWRATAEELTERIEDRVWKRRESPSLLKGVLVQTNLHAKGAAYPDAEDDRCAPLHPEAHAYLMEFMDYCKASGLDNVVFVRFPHTVENERQHQGFLMANEVGRIVEEHGFTYLPLNRQSEEIGLDPVYDHYNAEHLNISGQIKLTEYLASWMTDEYGLSPMPQSEENARFWDECIPYIEACNEISMEQWEKGLFEKFHEVPHVLEKLERRIEQWYSGDV